MHKYKHDITNLYDNLGYNYHTVENIGIFSYLDYLEKSLVIMANRY